MSEIKYMTQTSLAQYLKLKVYLKRNRNIEEVINALNMTMSYKIMNICLMFVWSEVLNLVDQPEKLLVWVK